VKFWKEDADIGRFEGAPMMESQVSLLVTDKVGSVGGQAVPGTG